MVKYGIFTETGVQELASKKTTTKVALGRGLVFDGEGRVKSYSGAVTDILSGFAGWSVTNPVEYSVGDLVPEARYGTVRLPITATAGATPTVGLQAGVYPDGGIGKAITTAGATGTYVTNFDGVVQAIGTDYVDVRINVRGNGTKVQL